MTEKQQQPREYDAVLGGQNPPPVSAAVLGGLEGVKMRLNSTVERSRVDAVSEALQYGDAGLDLVIEALKDKSHSVRRSAETCLERHRNQPKVQRALRQHNYLRFECLYTIEHPDSVLTISRDGNTLVSGSKDKTIKVFDLHSRRLRCRRGKPYFAKHQDSVNFVLIYPDGSAIIANDCKGCRKIWELDSGKLVQVIHRMRGERYVTAAMARNGTIVEGGKDGSILIGYLPGGGFRREHSASVNSVAISRRSKTVVSGSDDATIKVWDSHFGRVIWSFKKHSDSVNSVAITPDGNIVVSGSNDATIKVWNVQSGQLIRSFQGHSSFSVKSVAIAIDGNTIISGGADKTVKIWDLHSGELIRTLTGHSDSVNTVVVSPDGKIIASGSSDGTIKVWGIGP